MAVGEPGASEYRTESCVGHQKAGGCFSGVSAFGVLAGMGQVWETSYGRFVSIFWLRT